MTCGYVTQGVTRRMMRVATLQGEQLSFEVLPTNTLKELKVMIVARKHREDLTERKLCRVKVLAGGALLLDDDQTLESAGLMRAGCEVMVIYTRQRLKRQQEQTSMAPKTFFMLPFRPISRKLKISPSRSAKICLR